MSNLIISLFSSHKDLLPPETHTTDPEGWIVANNPHFNLQWIQCSYPISGQYGPTPRYVYYCLVVIAVLLRSRTWIATAITASVMTFSGVAAVHALVLVCIRQRLLSFGSWSVEIYSNHTWYLPVLPQVWDTDGDAVTAIVGVAFLVLAPMQIYSSTFQRSDAKAILFSWSLLLLIGIVSGLINEAYVGILNSHQFRFCPVSYNETLPITKSLYDTFMTKSMTGGPLGLVDWNETIWNAFTNTSSRRFDTCIYPCFSTSWPLRDPSEIVVTPSNGDLTFATGAWYVDFFIYTQVISSGVFSIAIFALRCSGWYQRQRSSLRTRLSSALHARPFFTLETAKKYGHVWCALHLLVIDAYAKFGSPIALVCFTAWSEWQMWYDASGEDFRHVGQWGALVGAGLVFIAAVVSRYSGKVNTYYTAYAAKRSADGRNGVPRLYTLKAVWRSRNQVEEIAVREPS